MRDGISVILCCHNSVGKLEPTLQHLQVQQNMQQDEWEIILVDNASTDGTAEFAAKTWNSNSTSVSFRIVAEPEPGLAHARKRGISEAQYRFLLFCDDDNWLNPNYVREALEIMRQNPKIGVLGAFAQPEFEAEAPPFFDVNQYHALATGPQYTEEGDITNSRAVVYGAGMVVNKVAYEKLVSEYHFSFQTSGRKGKSMASSEDHELCLALKQIGYRIFWSKKLALKHFIPTSRTTINYYRQLFFGFGTSYPYLLGYGINGPTLQNDYRYMAARNLKNIIKLQLMLFFKGFYFASDSKKYQWLHILQGLQTNKGSLKTLLREKNNIRDRFLSSMLYRKTRHSKQHFE